jgi:lipopolysaccharide/colanic/teichoic acid biosynthesis glycosyltransferase
MHPSRQVVKRAFDLIAAIAGILFLSPLILLTATLVRLLDGRPVLFGQVRAGLYGRPFTIYKFRTMTDACNIQGSPLPDSDRLTRLGALLRRTSIDELPELWNVVRGDMSLVGPRPLFMEYLPYYTEREQKRHQVKPGITGLAQTQGRNLLSWDDRLEMDVRYVEQISLLLDMRLLIITIWKTLAQNDILVVPSSQQERLDACRASDRGTNDE